MSKHLVYACLVIIITLYACSNNSGENSFKVMTLHIRYDNPQDSINAWPERESIVIDFIHSARPDLLGMQEVMLHQYESLDSALIEYGSIAVGRNDGAKTGEMNPLFFRKDRFNQIRSKTFWLSSTPEIPGSMGWGASLPRIVTWIELVDKVNKQHFFLFNTHFAHDSDSARIMSSRILLQSVDSIAGGFPFIITGDFNMLPCSEGYKILTGPNESVPLLDDSFTVSGKTPSGPENTFNGFSDNHDSGRIDYIFVKSGMKVLEHTTEIKRAHGVFISDHWPVQAIISFN
jgi:endonuclease/exonuclease/phosphatase family metal-dependent hydrolase